MLYFDGISLSKFIPELRENLIGRKITKIAQYDKYSLSLSAGKSNFYITVNPALPIAYIADSKEDAPHTQVQFNLVLRKYIMGGIISNIEQSGFDRIIKVKIERINELGENVISFLIIELMGKHSNIFLLDNNNKIIDLLKKFSIEENSLRILLPGSLYKKPDVSEKILPTNATPELFAAVINSEKDIVTKIEGFGKHSALYTSNNFKAFTEFLSSTPVPTIYYLDGKVMSGACFNFESIKYDRKESFPTINAMINFFVESTFKSSQYSAYYSHLKRVIGNELSKTREIIEKIKCELIDNKDFEKYKVIGDILAANLYLIKRNQSAIMLDNFYDGTTIEISLNPDISPADNLNRYYKKYNKLKKGYEYSESRLLNMEEHLEYVVTLDTHLDTSESLDDLRLLEEELVSTGIISKTKRTASPARGKKVKSYTEFPLQNGMKAIVGKNNIENDTITFKLSDKNDMWLHIKNLPGSHVIIRKSSPNDEISPSVLQCAAEIAAYYSSAKAEKHVTVDYTLRKNVSKLSGAKPGFVIYKNEKSIIVTPGIPKTK